MFKGVREFSEVYRKKSLLSRHKVIILKLYNNTNIKGSKIMFKYIKNKELRNLLKKDFVSDIVKKDKINEYVDDLDEDIVLKIIQEDPELARCKKFSYFGSFYGVHYILDIRDEDTIPDETTICKFRNKLIKEELLGDIFDEVKKMMESKRLILNEGTLIDATLIHSSEPKRKKDDKGKIISNKAADSDATYTSKRDRKHHGLKMHIATDTNGIIKKVITTTASIHDSTQFDALSEDEDKAIFADSGYMQKARKITLRAKGIFAGIVERRVRGQSKLRPKQSRNNTRFSKIRCLVELPFAFIKQHMKFRETRYLGIQKNQQHFFMLAACYNLRRTPALIRARN